MFNKDFFPTPTSVIKKMLAPYSHEATRGRYHGRGYKVQVLEAKKVFDPSAGKGNILDYISGTYYNFEKKRNLFAVELESELSAIIKDKKYKLIGSDFLHFETFLTFDMIVMNPPFSAGAKHLLKAWEVSKGGDIVCLLNAATYDNTYSKERKLLKSIIDKHGTIERIGKAFSSTKDAERTTNAEIIIVRLKKEKVSNDEAFMFKDLDEDKIELREFKTFAEIANRNVLKSYESSYTRTIEAHKKLLKAKHELQHHSRDIINSNDNTNYAEQHQKFIEETNVKAWQTFLRKSKFAGFLTSRVRQQFERKFEEQHLIAFNERNMQSMLETLFYSQDGLLTDCIEEMFDYMTAWGYNKITEKGWKTNDAWRVNKKVILPSQFKIEYNEFAIGYQSKDYLNDIDRAMCYVSGLNFEDIDTITNALERNFKRVSEKGYSTSTNTAESTFFKMRFYKKLTLHLNFKDEYFLHKFNL